MPSSRSLQWLPTERVELRGGKIDEDLLSNSKRNLLYPFSWSDLLNVFKINHAMAVSNQPIEKQLNKTSKVKSSVSNDMQLFVESSSSSKVKGKLQLSYLNEQFEGSFIATPNLIKLKTIQPFKGMVAAVGLEPGSLTPFLQSNGGLSKVGQQQMYFLVFDIFHLYNLFRLKPQALLALYQEALAILKTKGATVEFGKIDPNSDLGNTIATWLHSQVKQKFKHSYCSPKGLLYSFQNLLALFPKDFIL
jgi:hypothetical protein